MVDGGAVVGLEHRFEYRQCSERQEGFDQQRGRHRGRGRSLLSSSRVVFSQVADIIDTLAIGH